MLMTAVIAGFVGFIIGALVVGILLWVKVRAWREQAKQLQSEKEHLQIKVAQLQEQQKWLQQAENELRDTFQALASQALQQSLQVNAEEFLKRVRDQLNELLTGVQQDLQGKLNVHREQIGQMIHPLSGALNELDKQIQELETKRAQAYGKLEEQLKELHRDSQELQRTTTTLVEVFRKSSKERGAWGEVQLRRIVEMAGMQEHVDFEVQPTSEQKRPDLIILLPQNGTIPVDAKVPLEHFWNANEVNDERIRQDYLQKHANAMRQAIRDLGQKAYWQQFKRAPEFVIMFVPLEPALAAAFNYAPDLLDEALKNRVLPATPVIFFALLKIIAYGWMQHQVIENTQQIVKLAQEFYKRLCTFLEHLTTVGKKLQDTVDAYNNALGSLEHRLLPSVQQLTQMGIGDKEKLAAFKPIDKKVRTLLDFAPPSSSEGKNDLLGTLCEDEQEH